MVGWDMMRREPFYTVMFALSLKENPLHQSQECRKPSTEFTSSSVRRASSDDHQTAMQVPELALCREYPTLEIQKFAEIASWVGSTRHSLPQRNSYKVSILFQCSRVCRITEWCLRRGTERESGYVSSCYCISSWKYWNMQSQQVAVVHADYR